MLDAIICKRCGMAYFPHSAEDKAAHLKYHNYTTSAIRLRVSNTWKKKLKIFFSFLQNLKHQHVLQQFLDGSIYMIGCTSPSAEQKKAEHVRELIDNELGITTPFNCLWNETKVNYIAHRKNKILFFFRHISISKIVQILFLVIVLLILFIE